MCRWLFFFFCFFFCILPHLTFCFWHTEFRFKYLCQNSLTRQINIKVVGFVLKKLLTYFEMLIVPHALHCIFCILLHLTQSGIVFWFQCPPPTPLSPFVFVRFSFFVKIHLLQSSQLELYGYTPPKLAPNFLSDLVLAPSSLHQPPPDKGYTVREYY